ncbi:hypothetical protein CA54_20880 [Symmachiella macrocystis]|uniref:Tetratricopeptide repeat protein n=1 Tax=Symmachiella macrocystis TaxID=2527985 RepID=A0A5C6BMK4_9PLAN|nr:hypothetical protein [Symmachiella macrocystis]TWU13255.1 hypothetical protein CA54_20880 [Symmachiella macrocystis]
MKTFQKTLIVASLALTMTFAANLEDAAARGRSGGGSRGGSRGGFSRGGGSRGGSSRGGFNRGGGSRGGSNRGGFNRGGSSRGGNRGGTQSRGPSNGGRHNGGRHNGGFQNGGRHNNGGSQKGGRQIGGSKMGGRHIGGRHNGGRHRGGQHKGHWNHGGHHHKHGKGFGKWHGGHFGHRHGRRHHHGWGFGHRRHRRYFGWGFGLYSSFVNVRPTYTYCNPYCVANVISVYDYNQPLEVAGEDPQLSEIASNYFAEAREAFYAGDLKTAMEKIELAIKEMPSNSDLHQFRSLVLFSMKQYGQAAASAHVALTAGPGWNWDTLKNLYPSADIYTARLRDLEETRDQNKQDPAIRFLLAYHYLMLNHIESAAKELTQVVALEPRDELAAKMLGTITGQEVETQQPAQYQQPAEQPQTSVETNSTGLGALSNAGNAGPASTDPVQQPKEAKLPEQAKIVGEFRASPAEGVEFQFVLNADKTFVWTFKSKDETSSFEGTYTVSGNEMTLVRKKDGDKLVGIMTPTEKGFDFKIQGGDPKDPGLKFTK